MHQRKVLLQTYIKFLASEIFFSLTGSKKVLFIISRINFGKMTKLSVNVNKIATLRNARGGNMPNVLKVALDCEVLALTESRYILARMNDISAILTCMSSDLS